MLLPVAGLTMLLWGTSGLAVRAASDAIAPGQLFLAGGLQSFTVTLTSTGTSDLSAVTLVDSGASPSCSAPVGGFAIVDASTLTFSDDPGASCLAQATAGDVVTVQLTLGGNAYDVDASTPLVLASGAAAASAQATGSPTPADPTSTPGPTPSLPAASSPSASGSPAPTVSPTSTPTPGSTPDSDPPRFTLTSSSMSLAGLEYSGNTAITAGFAVMQFTMSGSSAANLSITTPCANGVLYESSAGKGSSASLSGVVSLSLTSLSGTDTGTGSSFAFTPASPPPIPWPYAGPYTGVIMQAAQITAAQISWTDLVTTATSC